MKCPVCKSIQLHSLSLQDGPLAHHCQDCQGYWITSPDYWHWLEQQNKTLQSKAVSQEVPQPMEDETDKRARLCPDCGCILLKYKIGHGISFLLDRCSGCGGVWFDKEEWDTLKSHHLHDEIHNILSPAWQKKMQQEEQRLKFKEIFESRFGADDYAKIREIKRWIDQHTQQQALLAYLHDEDPYLRP